MGGSQAVQVTSRSAPVLATLAFLDGMAGVLVSTAPEGLER